MATPAQYEVKNISGGPLHMDSGAVDERGAKIQVVIGAGKSAWLTAQVFNADRVQRAVQKKVLRVQRTK